MSGAEAMDRMIARVRELGELNERTAEEARARLEAAAKVTAAAGTSPEGEPWKPRKADGGRPLANAPASIAVRVLGAVLQVVVRGHHFFHQAAIGTGKKGKRKIIPDDTDTIPARYSEAIRGAAVVAFGKIVGRK